MTTKILSTGAAVFFILITLHAGFNAISTIGNTTIEQTIFAFLIFLTVAALSAFSSYFAICKFRNTCDSL